MDISLSILNATPEEVAQLMKNVADHANSGSQSILKLESKLGDVNMGASVADGPAAAEDAKPAKAARSHKKKVEAPAKPAKVEEPEEDEEDDEDEEDEEDEDEKPAKKKSKQVEDDDDDEDEKPAKKVELEEAPKKITIETIRKAAGQLAGADLEDVMEATLKLYEYETISDIEKDSIVDFYNTLVKKAKKAQK